MYWWCHVTSQAPPTLYLSSCTLCAMSPMRTKFLRAMAVCIYTSVSMKAIPSRSLLSLNCHMNIYTHKKNNNQCFSFEIRHSVVKLWTIKNSKKNLLAAWAIAFGTSKLTSVRLSHHPISYTLTLCPIQASIRPSTAARAEMVPFCSWLYTHCTYWGEMMIINNNKLLLIVMFPINVHYHALWLIEQSMYIMSHNVHSHKYMIHVILLHYLWSAHASHNT